MRVVTDLLLAIMVLAAWLGTIGFLRLRSPFDRLHCVTFVNAACGVCLLLAAVLADGLSDRVLKILLMVAVNLLSGAAVAHVTGRALLQRQASQ